MDSDSLCSSPSSAVSELCDLGKLLYLAEPQCKMRMTRIGLPRLCEDTWNA